MPGDTLEVFGNEFTNVAGIKATDSNSQTKTYIRPQGTISISANATGIDVAAYATADVAVTGTSKNVQIAQSTSRATSSTYTKLCGDITVATTGTYDVYWDCFRSSTGGTNGSQFYIGDTAYGTANTTFTNHAQTNHLSNVSLTANDKVSVYARSRGSNYYAYVGTLVIKQA